ncbi:tetratricopeptide repeat protein [Nocardioides guangzhouensis]|uniref:Tetratricopeptide repeat protein n=1 Tax=Nocardioides guangzhouensis TaxID=2497878 RepID=A0A4Q4ZA74_9ACTN|nr:tetratricopeptide repeat protein [Nocardioides guangzhouensis]RYP84131.1 tetratricopeptide repeat protein [Nocardioides guangzhouensis]
MADPAELWDFDDPVASEQRFREAAVGEDSAVMLTQVARALGLQERYAEAHEVLDEVAAHPRLSPEVQARVHLERGRLHRSAGDAAAAETEFDVAALRARAAGLEALHIDALHMQALVADPVDAVMITEQALALAAVAEDEGARNWDASLLNNLGMLRVEAGRLEDALDTFEDALAARERIGVPADVRVARWMVAWTLRLLGRTDEALAVQRELKAELEAAGATDPHVDEELALLEAGG